ncbi:hypothetical protein EV702DRAFT_199802 [Suillus placidus]|uniref:ATP-dependent DNA helicase n=1 Tax=Suillus placidus TaxID=48579 RepID=A0A9P7D2K0_9AGAM|nr:hypothetical protein EV702DRAFT_199802 [Suillus placidus]
MRHPMLCTRSISQITTSVRTIGDPEYTEFVDEIGEDKSGARREINIIDNISDVTDAIDFLFPPHILADPEECIQRAFLSSRNVFVDKFNDVVQKHCQENEIMIQESYFSSDVLKEAGQVPADAPEQTPTCLAMLIHPNTPPHRLDLQVNAICAAQRNMSVEKGADPTHERSPLPPSHHFRL